MSSLIFFLPLIDALIFTIDLILCAFGIPGIVFDCSQFLFGV